MSLNLSELLSNAVLVVWGVPLVSLLIGGGLYLCMRSRFLPLLGFAHAFKLLSGEITDPSTKQIAGQISHFKALSNALAATIGTGSIGGVAVAIYQGGPGAVFWMWVAALIGMITKYFECTLAIKYRGIDYKGEVQGGPMYTIQNALSSKWLFSAFAFSGLALISSIPVFNANQLAAVLSDNYGVEPLLVGGLMAALAFYVIGGGVKRLANVTSSLVPFMCLAYVFFSLLILFKNIAVVPAVFVSIFTHAFTGEALFGGAAGSGIMFVLMTGVKRGSFSSEAGVGTAPMAHGNARTSEPVAEGLVAMLGPFIDTVVICSMTALVILTSTYGYGQKLPDLNGVLLTSYAFKLNFGVFGGHFVAFATMLFALTTVLGGANYAQKSYDYLFRGKLIFKDTVFKIYFCSGIIFSTVASLNDAINLIDMCFALMVVPNMLTTICLAPEVLPMTKKYFEKYKLCR